MGADGGVTWVRAKDARRLFELIGPLGFWPSLNDGYESEHGKYLEAHPVPEDYVVLPYGTNHELQGFDSIRDMIQEADIVEQFFYDGAEMTFADVVVDVITRPLYEARPRPLNTFERALFKVFFLSMAVDRIDIQERAFAEMAKEPVFSMTLREWARQVDRTIEIRTLGSAETWT